MRAETAERIGREERIVRKNYCQEICTLIVPATARLKIEVDGYTAVTRSVFLDTPELLESALNTHLEQLLEAARAIGDAERACTRKFPSIPANRSANAMKLNLCRMSRSEGA